MDDLRPKLIHVSGPTNYLREPVHTALATPTLAQRSVYVQGHTTSNGNYVPPHYRTAANETRTDNWSSAPNVNPYTGEQGHRDPDAVPQPRNPYESNSRSSYQSW